MKSGCKMAKIMLGAHIVKSHGANVAKVHKYDWLILLLLVVIDISLNKIEPFHRFVGEDMMTDLKYPFKKNTIPIWSVPIYSAVLPFVIFLVYYIYRKDVYDFHHSILGILFSLAITGVLTDAIKDTVGRPRPDFFWRCFPNGIGVFDPITKGVICHGKEADVKEGYKSFPSGHTSWSFAGLTFLTLYLSGKIRAFDRKGHIAKQCIVFFPMLGAVLVGVSRVDDYWHHWQDVFAGAVIGITVALLCYLHFFPYPHNDNGWAPHAYFHMLEERNNQSSVNIGNSDPEHVNNGSTSETGIRDCSADDSNGPILEAMEAGKRHKSNIV